MSATGLVPTITVIIRSRIDNLRNSHWLDTAPTVQVLSAQQERLKHAVHPLAFSTSVGTARATHVIDRNPRAQVLNEVIYHALKKIAKKSPPEAAPEGTVPGGL